MIQWTVACQAPLSMELSMQEYWSGYPFLSAGDLPNQGLNPGLLHCRQILYYLSHQGSPSHALKRSKSIGLLSLFLKKCMTWNKHERNKTKQLRRKEPTLGTQPPCLCFPALPAPNAHSQNSIYLNPLGPMTMPLL